MRFPRGSMRDSPYHRSEARREATGLLGRVACEVASGRPPRRVFFLDNAGTATLEMDSGDGRKVGEVPLRPLDSEDRTAKVW